MTEATRTGADPDASSLYWATTPLRAGCLLETTPIQAQSSAGHDLAPKRLLKQKNFINRWMELDALVLAPSQQVYGFWQHLCMALRQRVLRYTTPLLFILEAISPANLSISILPSSHSTLLHI